MFRKAYLLIPALVFISFSPAECEVKLDGSLGTQGNVQGPNYSIEAAMGKQMGSSLFHSFDKFDINTGENATFKGPADIERIISRVTGGNPSKIDGAIRSEIQGADFYFINPFGMIFGPNASLDITGSFFATSADYVKLGENGRFDARNPENSVLTADAPEAFGFLGQKPGNITVEARKDTGFNEITERNEFTGLEVKDNSRIMIAGGDINVNGGMVKTHAGDLDVVSVKGKGEIDLNAPDASNLTDLGMIEINYSGEIGTIGGGNLNCQAASLNINSGSGLSTRPITSPKAGDVDVNVKQQIVVDGMSSDNLSFSTLGSFAEKILMGESGDVSIKCSDLDIQKGAAVVSQCSNGLSAGKITLDVCNLNLLNGGSISSSLFEGTVTAGNIDINASESVYVSGFYGSENFFSLSGIFSNTYDSLNVEKGNITVKSPDIVIEQLGKITTKSFNSGSAGNINLDAARLRLLEGGEINASISRGNGNAGDITLNATELIVISDNFSQVISCAIGSLMSEGGSICVSAPEVIIEKGGMLNTYSIFSSNSGDINLDVSRLNLLEGGWIDTSIKIGSGNAGIININASESVIISGNDEYGPSQITSSAIDSYNAHAGDIYVSVPKFTIEKSGLISVSSFSAGNSGNIKLDIAKLNLLEGGWINASISGSSGKGGNIDINASESVIISGSSSDGPSQIASKAWFCENAGERNICVSTPEITIEKGGMLSASSIKSGNSGDINLDIARLNLFEGGWITASLSEGSGKTGDININASESVIISGRNSFGPSQIASKTSNSESSFGGNISVSAPDVLIEKSGTVSTSSIFAGNSGNISFTGARFSFLDGGLINTSVSEGFGKAGDISIKASDSIIVSQNKSLISAMAISSSSFPGGNISLDSPVIKISETARISCISEDSGPAGNIAFKCYEFSLSDHSFIMTSANASDGGSISIDCKDYFQMNLGGISTSVHDAEGNGGNIEIKRPRISTLYRSEIVADAHGGNGGNMDISSGFFIRDIYSIISASSALGIDGNIVIDSPEIDLNSGLIKLAEEYQDLAGFIKDPCIERMSGKSSSLTNGSALRKQKSPFEYFESSTQRY